MLFGGDDPALGVDLDSTPGDAEDGEAVVPKSKKWEKIRWIHFDFPSAQHEKPDCWWDGGWKIPLNFT